MPIIAYTEEDLRLQFQESQVRRIQACLKMIEEDLRNPKYLDEMMDAYHVEKTTHLVAMIYAILEDVTTRIRKRTDIPFEIYPVVQEEFT